MSIDHVALIQLQNDLALRPLSAQAIRLAHDLVRGVNYLYDSAFFELEEVGLATMADDRCFDDADAEFAPTDLLLAMYHAGRMDVLEARR